MESILGVGTVIFLVLANAFFVASEFSLVSARRTRIDQLALEGNRAAIAARHWTNAVSDES
jgi:putative hemolysin